MYKREATVGGQRSVLESNFSMCVLDGHVDSPHVPWVRVCVLRVCVCVTGVLCGSVCLQYSMPTLTEAKNLFEATEDKDLIGTA